MTFVLPVSKVMMNVNPKPVLVEYDVTARMPALPSKPQRFSSLSVTRRKWLP